LFAVIVLSLLVNSNEYFSSRLSFADSENLTTLVFFQGWHLAFLNMMKTSGFGLGFQMLGMPGTYLPEISETIKTLTGNMFNLKDGGFLAAKVIAEFGVLGVIASLFYFVFITKFIFQTNKFKNIHPKNIDMKYTSMNKLHLLNGLIFGFLVEYYFRGYGYFSPGLYLVFAILMSIRKIPLFGKSLYL
jgi:hypothetical protein